MSHPEKPPGPPGGKSATRLKTVADLHQEIPPHDIPAEAAVLSAVLIDASAFEKVRGLLPGHFFSEAHRRIFDAALYVHVEGKPVDYLTVATWLKEHDRLSQVGGMAYITEILNAAPATAHVQAYADTVRRCSRERDVLRAAQKAIAEIYAHRGKPAAHVFVELKAEIERAERDGSETEHGAIQFLEHDAIYAPQPDADLVVPSLGIGKGPAIGIFGQGFVGKSVAGAFAMGMAVAGGLPLWGNFQCRRGIWVHLDHEQGARRTSTLIVRMTRGMGLEPEALRGRIKPAIYPRVNLTSPGALDHYCRAFEGATVATADALKGMTPGVEENSSEIREYIDLLGHASEKTGCMVVLLHHAGKTPMDGSRPRKEAGRGSSGIFDACASVFVMSADKGKPTMVTHEKDRELGYLVEDFGLRIEDVPHEVHGPRWGLRVVHLDREQMKPQGPTDEQVAQKAADDLAAMVSLVRACIRKTPGQSREAVRDALEKKRGSVASAIDQLIASGEVVERTRSGPKGGRGNALYLASAAPPDKDSN